MKMTHSIQQLNAHQADFHAHLMGMNKRLILLISSMALVATTSAISAAELEPAKLLRQTALTFLEQQTAQLHDQEAEISINHLDSRLRLTQCSEPPTAFLTPGTKLQGKISVGLRCSGQKPWTVYIPATIKNFASIVAAAQPLPRGTVISDSDLMSVRQDLSQLRGGYYTKAENITGNILTRSMSKGQAFSAKYIKPPLLVHRGDEVTISASIGDLKVRVKGQALKDASEGQQIPVRNKQSKRIVQGIAIKPGVVSVQM